MELKKQLIEQLKKYNGQRFHILLETAEGFSTFTDLGCGKIYVAEEYIDIIEQGYELSFVLMTANISSLEIDGAEDDFWIDNLTIEYKSGTRVIIEVFNNSYVEAEEAEKGDNNEVSPSTQEAMARIKSTKEFNVSTYNRAEYIADLRSRPYFPKEDEKLIQILTTLKGLEREDLLISYEGNFNNSKFVIEDMYIDECVGDAVITDGIQLWESDTDSYFLLCDHSISSFKSLDILSEGVNKGYEVRYEDDSTITIEVLE